jgi:hypothetical protein
MEVQGSAQDSGVETEGVETEGELESNDSSMSSVSVGVPQHQAQALPVVANSGIQQDSDNFQVPQAAGLMASARITPEPSMSSMSTPPNGLQPPPSVTEDGYLGDCSSDGGNEKNFPVPAHLLKRLVNSKTCPCHPESKSDNGGSSGQSDPEVVEPPAGLAFQNVSPSNAFGYQVLPQMSYGKPVASAPRKMRSSLRSRLVLHGNNWSQMKAILLERKLRMAVSTNNLEHVTRLLESGANVNSADEQLRTALHFAASKGYSDILNTLLQNGADPNAKDMLGNTALHLAACTNHIEVVTLLLRAGTDITTLDNNGRTPMQLAQSKLNLLQKNSNKAASEMSKVCLHAGVFCSTSPFYAPPNFLFRSKQKWPRWST